MADFNQDQEASASLPGLVGQNAFWLSWHRGRQVMLSRRYGALERAASPNRLQRFGYGWRTYFGYKATGEELARWGSKEGSNWFTRGTRAATTNIMNPVMAISMAANPAKYQINNAFNGVRMASEFATRDLTKAAAMSLDDVGVFMTNSFLRGGESMSTIHTGNIYNRALFNMYGGTTTAGKATSAKEGLEALSKGALMVAGKSPKALRVAAWGLRTAGVLTAAYDVAWLTSMATTAALKMGEMYYVKIPKAYINASTKNFMRARGEGIGPATVMSSENMNNRMRAVQAIQGSRLNARNALGNEAGLLHGHFG